MYSFDPLSFPFSKRRRRIRKIFELPQKRAWHDMVWYGMAGQGRAGHDKAQGPRWRGNRPLSNGSQRNGDEAGAGGRV